MLKVSVSKVLKESTMADRLKGGGGGGEVKIARALEAKQGHSD